jgi:hypothetical protein
MKSVRFTYPAAVRWGTLSPATVALSASRTEQRRVLERSSRFLLDRHLFTHFLLAATSLKILDHSIRNETHHPPLLRHTPQSPVDFDNRNHPRRPARQEQPGRPYRRVEFISPWHPSQSANARIWVLRASRITLTFLTLCAVRAGIFGFYNTLSEQIAAHATTSHSLPHSPAPDEYGGSSGGIWRLITDRTPQINYTAAESNIAPSGT